MQLGIFANSDTAQSRHLLQASPSLSPERQQQSGAPTAPFSLLAWLQSLLAAALRPGSPAAQPPAATGGDQASSPAPAAAVESSALTQDDGPPMAPPTESMLTPDGGAPASRPNLVAGLLQLLQLQELRGSNISRCGNAPLTATERLRIEMQVQTRLSSERSSLEAPIVEPEQAGATASNATSNGSRPAAPPARPPPIIAVNTYVHVVSRGPGLVNGEVPQAQVDAQMLVLNQAYLSCRVAFKLVSAAAHAAGGYMCVPTCARARVRAPWHEEPPAADV